MDSYIPHLWYKDLADSNIWRGSPNFLDGSWDFVRTHWAQYDPESPHPVQGAALNAAVGDRPLLSDEFFKAAPIIGGRPVSFTGVVSQLQPLENLPGDRKVWVMQVVSSTMPDWRAYVQFNGSADLLASGGDVVVILDGVAIAGGSINRTDGRTDNAVYVLAQDVLVAHGPN
jgi:hypothetical protein